MAEQALERRQAEAPGIWQWLDERLGLNALAYDVPAHANSILYTLGGVTFIGFMVLIITGIILAQYYDPMPQNANESVLYIKDRARFMGWVRGIHFWMANAVVLGVILHLVRVFASGSFKRPREVNWLVGIALLAITMGFVFTGTILKWDQEAYEALQHNKEVARLLGSAGTLFSSEFTESVPLQVRLYIAHIAILPALLVLGLLAHFYLVKHHGMAPLATDHDRSLEELPGRNLPPEPRVPFTSHLRFMTGAGLLLIAIVALLAAIFEPPLGPRPTPGIEVTKPPWMFLPLYPLEDWFGIKSLIYAPIVLFVLLALVPFVDRVPFRKPQRRSIILAATVVFLAVIVLGIAGALVSASAHVMGE